jgi:UDP-glucuronate 4-epimerase
MSILITGAAGFIGSNLCEKMVEMGYSIIGIDNFDVFYSAKQKYLNLTNLSTKDNFEFINADIRDKESLNKIFRTNKIEAVIHLAAKAGVRPSIDLISDYYDVNINGTISVLEVMKNNGITSCIFASSSSVYGNNAKIPFCESDKVDNPISPYASTKKSGELLCHVYYHLHSFDITCLRFFTVYGPRQRPDLAIHKFTRMIDTGIPIPLYGDGSTARDYTYIDDIVNGIISALEHLGGYRIYNLGESKLVDLQKLVQTVEKLLNKKATLNMFPFQPGDVNITYADISKAQREIGYDPKYEFAEGVEKFIEWYQLNKELIY